MQPRGSLQGTAEEVGSVERVLRSLGFSSRWGSYGQVGPASWACGLCTRSRPCDQQGSAFASELGLGSAVAGLKFLMIFQQGGPVLSSLGPTD